MVKSLTFNRKKMWTLYLYGLESIYNLLILSCCLNERVEMSSPPDMINEG
jgi:hypothetical protein